MKAPYRVDLDQLLATIDSLVRCEEGCDDALDVVSRRVGALHGTWTGLAADAQAVAQTRWEAGFADMRAGLAQMRGAAQTAEANYSAAVAANLRMWSL